ncbi:MAG TPA: cellulase family glycosylhydrolase, partial [Candidatus Caenarcaniphilales bacterium]
AVHPYDQYNRGDTQQVKNQRLADYFDRVRAQDLVIMVGEFGSKNNREDTTPVVEAIYRTAVPRGIGRIVWNWWGGDKNDLTTSGNGGGWHINSCTNPTNLTWLGEQVWRDTHRKQ